MLNKSDSILKSMFLYGAYAVVLIIILRMFQLQVVQHNFYDQLGQQQSLQNIEVKRGRGLLVDRMGEVVVGNKQTASLYAFGKDVSDPKGLQRELRRYGVHISNNTVERLNKPSFSWVSRRIDIDTAKAVKKAYPYVDYIYEEQRYYPQSNLLKGVLGRTGVDNQGLNGLERAFETVLKGSSYSIQAVHDSRGNQILLNNALVNKNTLPVVQLTLSIENQAAGEYFLRKGVSAFGADSGIAVAMDIQTGDILLAASFFANKSTVVRRGQQYAKSYPSTFLFEPGSIFKAVTYAYMMEVGLYNANRTHNVREGFSIAGHTITDSSFLRNVITEQEIFTISSNIGVSQMMRRVNASDYHDFLNTAGLGRKLGTYGLTEESGLLRNIKQWSQQSKYSISFGQEILTTPLQMLYFFSAVANDGVGVTPRIVQQYSAGAVSTKAPKVVSVNKTRIMSLSTSQDLRQLLRLAVLNGTGRKALNNITSIAGKTGTSQKFDRNRNMYSTTDYIASFAGFFPYESPRIAMIVLYDSPTTSIYGGQTAILTFNQIAQYLTLALGLPNSETLRELKELADIPLVNANVSNTSDISDTVRN